MSAWVGLKKEFERAKSKEGALSKVIIHNSKLSKSHFHQIINGKRRPGKDKIKHLAQALDLSEEYILGLLEEKPAYLEDLPKEKSALAQEKSLGKNEKWQKIKIRKTAFFSLIALFSILGFFLIFNSNNKSEKEIPSAPVKLTSKIKGDSSSFIKDVTIPDGTYILIESSFSKTWRIKNTGSVIWENRFLMRVTPFSNLTCHSDHLIPIKKTSPGEDVDITVTFKSMKLPGSCRTDWKMVDRFHSPFFLNKHGLYSIVNVTDNKNLIEDDKARRNN